MPRKAEARPKLHSAPTVEGGSRFLSRCARWAAEEQQDGLRENNGPDTQPRLREGVAVSGSSPGRKKPTNLAFYGIPAATIAQVCGVALSTARSYKNGTRRPSRAVVTLIQLWKDGRMLGPEWKGWRVHKGELISPENQVLRQGQVRAFVTCMQLLYEVTRGHTEYRAIIDAAFDKWTGTDGRR